MDDRAKQQTLTLIAIALTFASGATDVASFTRLGGVFTSVMTGNIVLLGLSVARGSLTLATHTLVSIGGYIVGVACGSWISHLVKLGDVSQEGADASETGGALGGGGAGGAGRVSGLPSHVTRALIAELILLAGFTVGWEVSGASPVGWAQFCLLATAAVAMGMQSSTVLRMGLSEVSTTYLTGTLTGLINSLVSPGQRTAFGPRRIGVLLGLAVGAGLSGLLVATAADGVPALALAALIVTLVLAVAPQEWRARWPGVRWPGVRWPGVRWPGVRSGRGR